MYKDIAIATVSFSVVGFHTCNMRVRENRAHLLTQNLGKNGPLPSILEIICSETLFPNYIAMYHFFGPIAAFS